MAASKIGLGIWLGGVTLLWALQPLLWSHARGVLVLSIVTALLALLAWLFKLPLLITWSGAVGLCNLTLALILTSQPPNLWAGLSAGITLLALMDGSHRFTYLRHCWLAPGVVMALLSPFVLLSGLTLAVGMALSFIIPLAHQSVGTSAAGFVTITGACLLVGFLALFLLRTSR